MWLRQQAGADRRRYATCFDDRVTTGMRGRRRQRPAASSDVPKALQIYTVDDYLPLGIVAYQYPSARRRKGALRYDRRPEVRHGNISISSLGSVARMYTDQWFFWPDYLSNGWVMVINTIEGFSLGADP